MNLSGSKTLKAAALAITLGAAAFTSLPAQAQSFGFQFGNGDFFDHGRDRHHSHPTCLTDYQVRQRVARYGYDNIYLNVARDQHIQVKASRGSSTYLIDFNRCTGRIESAQRLQRPGRDRHWDDRRWDNRHWGGYPYGGGDDKDEAGDLH